MKAQQDIDREVNATLDLGAEMVQVMPTADLKHKIMERITGSSGLRTIPFYRRVGFVAAAAVLILAMNIVTVIYYSRKSSPQNQASQEVDRLDDIRSVYALDETNY